MGQYRISQQVQDRFKPVYDSEDNHRKLPATFSGFPIDWIPRPMKQDSEEERQATYQSLWDRGAFHFWRRSSMRDRLAQPSGTHCPS
jgi:hypothetical protein